MLKLARTVSGTVWTVLRKWVSVSDESAQILMALHGLEFYDLQYVVRFFFLYNHLDINESLLLCCR